MARDTLLAGLLGFASAGVGTYALHRALWKTADERAASIEALIPGHIEKTAAAARQKADADARAEKAGDTLERYWRQRTAQSWNALVDNVHARLLNLPRTLETIRDDAAAALDASMGSQPESELLTEEPAELPSEAVVVPEPELDAAPQGKPAE